MAFSYPLTPPTSPVASAVTVVLQDATALEQSDFTLQTTSYDFGGERLAFRITLPPMRETEADDWAAFFIKCKGTYGTFTFGNAFRKTLQGSASGSVLVNGADQTGNTLNVDGLSNNLAVAFNNYDHFSLTIGSASRLKICVANSSSNGSGQAALTIYPAIVAGASPADNAALTLTSATGTFRLAEPVTFDIGLAKIYGFSFTCIEAF